VIKAKVGRLELAKKSMLQSSSVIPVSMAALLAAGHP